MHKLDLKKYRRGSAQREWLKQKTEYSKNVEWGSNFSSDAKREKKL
jgi:hypothetical protein